MRNHLIYLTVILMTLISFPVSAKDDVAPISEWRSVGYIKEIHRLIYSEIENRVDIQFYFKPGGEFSKEHVLFCHYQGKGREAIETAKLIENDFDSIVFEVQGILRLRGRLIHNIGPKLGYSRVYAEINLLKVVGKSVAVELTWVTIAKHYPDINYGSLPCAAAANGCTTYELIGLMAAALPSLPDDITVTNARIELDYYTGSYGSGQIRRLRRGMSKTGSTWKLLNKNTGKTWYSGGPFLVGTDATTIFWAGNFNDNDPQVFNGNAALAAYIEGKGESNWVLFALVTLAAYDVKDYDGARLTFDYITKQN